MSKLRETIEGKIFCKERNLSSHAMNAKGYPGHHEFVYIVTLEQNMGNEIVFTPISWFKDKKHAVQCALDEYGMMKRDELFDMQYTTVFVDVQILNN